MSLPIRFNLHQVVSQVTGVKRHSSADATRAKVENIHLPAVMGATLGDREVNPVKEVKNLAKQIRVEWNFLAPEELAAKVIELEGRVACLSGETPGLEKIKRLAEDLHFRFVFPIVMELSGSFAKTISNLAHRVLKTQSLRLFETLSPTQQREVIRCVTKGDA